MAGASGQDKQMPDRVIERQFFPGIKDNPQRVGQAARDKSHTAAGRQGSGQRFDGKNDDPVHQDVGYGR